ncbi:NAD-dependent epimerase/dehydratase family protein [Lentilactobacillus parafarraginis]|nr:NAD(P)H-binding protein [Lentilactobacillus parafarraginis]TLQ19749.1 NAD-dependent epimerase/dehydratase family protein [Lentilactobacillus parafarraginis]
MTKIVVLAATGQIGQLTAQSLLDHSDADLVLFGHNAAKRLSKFVGDRVSLVDGDLKDSDALKRAFAGADAVFLALVTSPDIMKPLIKALDDSGTQRFIAMSIPDVYKEVTGPFQAWYREHTGLVWKTNYVDVVNEIENSDLDYVILRTTWLYNDPAKDKVTVTKKGEPFKSAQISREAVAKFAADLLVGKLDYHRESLGIGEPNTEWSKPSFY